jgi:hypothetical protein
MSGFQVLQMETDQFFPTGDGIYRFLDESGNRTNCKSRVSLLTIKSISSIVPKSNFLWGILRIDYTTINFSTFKDCMSQAATDQWG